MNPARVALALIGVLLLTLAQIIFMGLVFVFVTGPIVQAAFGLFGVDPMVDPYLIYAILIALVLLAVVIVPIDHFMARSPKLKRFSFRNNPILCWQTGSL